MIFTITSKAMRVFMAVAILNLLISGCILSPEGKGGVKSDIVLSGSDTQIAAIAKAQWPAIQYLANNPGKEKIVEFMSDSGSGEKVFLALSFHNENDEQFVNVRDIQSGKSVRISWAREGISPALNFLYNDGRSFIYKIFDGVSKTAEISLSSFFMAGLEVAAIGLAVWLGASVGKFVIATVAFLAFNLMMLGVVVAAGAFIVSFFHTMGWSGEVVINFLKAVFGNIVEEVKFIIQNTADILGPFLPKELEKSGSFLFF